MAGDLAALANTSNLEILKNFTLIKQGAEAKLYTGVFENKQAIVKERFKKTYRHPDLDKSLTVKRIKTETKLLNKAGSLGVDVPKVFKVDQSNGLIIMEYIEESITCREYIINLVKSNLAQEVLNEKLVKVSVEIGKLIAKLHQNLIIHGDLTTSNMLIKNPDQEDKSKIYFIDFGLSFTASQSSQLEDKAVDLYVLERAVISTHSLHASFIFDNILKGYELESKNNFNQVLDRLNQVRLRGRKRTMIG